MLPEAPIEPTVQILVNGDRCDVRACGARAYVRVCMYRRAGTTDVAGLLHWCGHHWREVADTFWLLQVAGKCSYLDETGWISR